MPRSLETPYRLVWIWGLLVLGIALATPPSRAQQTPEPPPGANPLAELLQTTEALLTPEQIAADTQKAAELLSNEDASLADLARSRFALARHEYSNAIGSLLAPPAPDSTRNDHLLQFGRDIHHAAEVAQSALSDLDQVPEDGLRFLKAHATRMRTLAEGQKELVAGTGGFGTVFLIEMQRTALEARSWALKAEQSVAGGSTGTDRAEGVER